MNQNPNQPNQVEGQWEELVRHADQFAGRRVRVTVLPDERGTARSLLREIRQWLAEGENIEVAPRSGANANAFGDGLVEKYRKQGLVL